MTKTNPVVRKQKIRVLYSFPHKIGADRICKTAWYQVCSAVSAGAEVVVIAGSVAKPLPGDVITRTTLAWNRLKKIRIPYRLLGIKRACFLHDLFVSRMLPRIASNIDVIHAWPMAALATLKVANRLGIPTLLERPNAHTRFAYRVVEDECKKLGISMPAGHEHSYKPDWLQREEAEYQLADKLLCPSDFVVQSFLDQGFPRSKLMRHQYGCDPKVFFPPVEGNQRKSGLCAIFVGGCAPRKGLHYALQAWLSSKASHTGEFRIVGEFIPGYADILKNQLSHPSIKVLGHRNDVPDLMRSSDVLILPTIEEGSALVTYEARACGCVLLVSEAAGAVCRHGENALVHKVGDVAALTRHLDMLSSDRAVLKRLRTNSLSTIQEVFWSHAGQRLVDAYLTAVFDKNSPISTTLR